METATVPLDLIYEICLYSLDLYQVAIYNREFHRYIGSASDPKLLRLQAAHTVYDKGDYRLCGRLHRRDGPATVNSHSRTGMWYQFGKLHRDDGPACVMWNGHSEWYRRGEFYRVDNPPHVYYNDSGNCFYSWQRVYHLVDHDLPHIDSHEIAMYKLGQLQIIEIPQFVTSSANWYPYTRKILISGDLSSSRTIEWYQYGKIEAPV